MLDAPTDSLRIFVLALISCEGLSLMALAVGSRLIGVGPLRRIGQMAEARKMRAVETTWPLTRLRPAVAREDRRLVSFILASLIALKSLLCLPLGLIMLFWLPPASLLVPSIVAAHDPDDEQLRGWARGVATLQVTSHALAASAGFVVGLQSLTTGGPLPAAIVDAARENAWLLGSAIVLSMVFAAWAGKTETEGVFRFGV